MSGWTDIFYASADRRLQLYARDYGAPSPDAMTVLCLHGLTRNSADFTFIASHLSPHYRVIVADQRGRGRSGWDSEPANYVPPVYCMDMIALLDHLTVQKAAIIGTSMGGLMGMIMGVTARDRILSLVLNDIGPDIDKAGLDRIRSYVGKTSPAVTWEDAARLCETTNAHAFPDYGTADWMAFARRTYADDAMGRPVLAYDPAIAKGMETPQPTAAPPDLWPLWDGLAGLPILSIRGGLSDLMTAECQARMAERHPGMTSLTLAGRGHAPMLDEPEAVAAIDSFLEQTSRMVPANPSA